MSKSVELYMDVVENGSQHLSGAIAANIEETRGNGGNTYFAPARPPSCTAQMRTTTPNTAEQTLYSG